MRIIEVGFIASAWQRIGLALLVIGMAAGLLVLVEYPRASRIVAVPAAPGSSQRRATLRLESSFPVATWSVRIAGVEIVAGHSDASTWQGVAEGVSGSEILIVVDGLAAQPQRGAVRIALDGDPQGDRSAWGDGQVVATVRVP